MVSKNLEQVAISIENTLNNNFGAYNSFISNIAKDIINQFKENADDDTHFILNILKNISNKENNLNKEKLSKILSFSLFDWVNANGLQTINTMRGIAQREVSDSPHVIKAKQNPGVLQIASPHVGKESNSWVIPASFGVVAKGIYLGAITWGFNIHNLTKLVEKKIPNDSFCFVVLDDQFNIIIKSVHNNISNKSLYYRDCLNGLDLFTDQQGFVEKPIMHASLKYVYYKKMFQYPYYIVLVGYDNEWMTKNKLEILTPSLVEFLLIVVALPIFFYTYRKKYTETATASNKAFVQLAGESMQRLRFDIELIYQHCNVLLKHLKKEIKVEISREKKEFLINQIRNTAFNLQQFSIANFDLTPINIEKMLKELILVHSHLAFIKNVAINCEIISHLPLFISDEISIRQIMNGIISELLDQMELGGNIKISACSEVLENKKYLSIIFYQALDPKKYLNIPFTKEVLQSTQRFLSNQLERFSTDSKDKIEFKNTNADIIMNLLKLHRGTFYIEYGENERKTILLTFPFDLNYGEI